MRGLLPLPAILLPAVLAVGLAAAGPAVAAGEEGAPPPKRIVVLRGPQSATPRRADRAKARPLPVPVAAAASSPPPPDPSQCRLDCAQAYYFCAADDDPDSCSGTWVSCLNRCSPSAVPAPDFGG